MAQGDYLIQNQSFPSFRSDLNDTLEAINTSNSGTSRPSSAVAGTVWLDTTSATTPTLKFYDGTDDISLATLDYTANTVNWLDSSVSLDIVSDTTPQLGGDLDVNGNDIVSVSNGNITFTPDGTGKVIIDGLSHPTADGTANQNLITDGAGNLSFSDVTPADNTVSLAKLTATGTKDATTFLRGDNTFAEAGGGKVLQVLTATDSTQRSTTSTSFVTASNTLSVDITPSATSSKVLIMISTVIGNNTEEAQAISTIYRDSTNLGDSTYGMLDTYHFGGTTRQSASLIFLDSPSSTSQLTYQLYVRGTGGTTEINYNGGKGSIIVMEIGA